MNGVPYASQVRTKEVPVKLEMRPYLHPAWLEKRDVENHITDRPHQAANSVRIASGAFPSTFESHTTRKLANNSSITNKEHVDQCPIPDNAQIHSVAAKGR